MPLIFSLWTSLTPCKLTRPQTLCDFVGLTNYLRIFTDWDFWAVFAHTIGFLTVALNVEFLLELGIALLINKITWDQPGLRTIMMLPMMFSPILVGFQFKFFDQRQYRRGEHRTAIAGADQPRNPVVDRWHMGDVFHHLGRSLDEYVGVRNAA